MSVVRVLSFHARYRCRHSGACCTARWPIPVEADRLGSLRAAIASGRVTAPNGGRSIFLETTDEAADAPALLGTSAAGCVFFDRGHEASNGRCRIQQALGHDALPLACRQFPRVSVIDPRGVSVTLSHYCPTAAALLDDEAPGEIVTGAPSFPAGAEYVGLEATDGLPPLLRPDMAMDWDAWWEWERLAVGIIGACGDSRAALDRLAAIVESIRPWKPSDGALVARIRHAAASNNLVVVARSVDPAGLVEDVYRAIPQAMRATAPDPPAPPGAWLPAPAGPPSAPGSRTSDRATKHLLAAHAFANWTAHLGLGLRTWLQSIDAALALLDTGLDVRQVDLLLRHLADPDVLARTWSAAETRPPHA